MSWTSKVLCETDVEHDDGDEGERDGGKGEPEHVLKNKVKTICYITSLDTFSCVGCGGGGVTQIYYRGMDLPFNLLRNIYKQNVGRNDAALSTMVSLVHF